MLRKKYFVLGVALLLPIIGGWILAAMTSWRSRELVHLPLTPNLNPSGIGRFEISRSQNLFLVQSRLRETSQWSVFQISSGATIFDRTTALWEAFALRPDDSGFVALELQPDATSGREETFYRPIFGDFATRSGAVKGERKGAMVALKDPNVATDLMFSRDEKSVYGLFTRDGAQWNLNGQLQRRISIGDDWNGESYFSDRNRATLDFLPDTTVYAQATDQQLSFWDFDSARKLFQVPALPKAQPPPATESDYVPLSEQSFSLRSQILAVVRLYNAPLLVVYDLKTGRELWRQTLSFGFPVCFLAPDGQTLIVAANDQLEMHDARNGQLLRRFPAPQEIVAAQNTGDFFFYLDGKFDLVRQRLR